MDQEEAKRLQRHRARLNEVIRGLRAGTHELTPANRDELIYLVKTAAWAKLVAEPALFLLAAPGREDRLIAFHAWLKSPFRHEHGPSERPLWQKATKPDA